MFLCFPLPHELDCQMAKQQWISPDYQPAPTFQAHCVALKTGFSMAWQGSNQQTKPQIFFFFKSTYLFAPFSHLQCIAFKLPHMKSVSSHCVQDHDGLFLMCLHSESPVRTNKLIIFTINMIILINVRHTQGFVQLETHIYIHIGSCVSQTATLMLSLLIAIHICM